VPYCSDCGQFIEPQEAGNPCSDCGSGDREIFVYDSVKAREALGITAKDNEGFRLFERTQREKLSHHGRDAKEQLVFDHRDPGKTIKTHVIEEKSQDGVWEIVHNETKEFPAKCRPKRKMGEADKNR
jgi:hypothetical protein